MADAILGAITIKIVGRGIFTYFIRKDKNKKYFMQKKKQKQNFSSFVWP